MLTALVQPSLEEAKPWRTAIALAKRTARICFACCMATALLAMNSAMADHRVALLISNSDYEDAQLKMPERTMETVAVRLTKRGFRCTVAKNLNEKQLKSTLESFANTTPTRGTALVYFHGQILAGSQNGMDVPCLLGVNSRKGRGYGLDSVFEQLRGRGGSQHQIFISDCPVAPSTKVDLPGGCLLAFVDTVKLEKRLGHEGDMISEIRSSSHVYQSTIAADVEIAGSGSQAISPPDKFMPGENAGDQWVNHRGIVFCWCPPGRYIAGSPAGTPGRYPDESQREVVIHDGFWIGKYELTLSQNMRNRPGKTIAEHKNHPLTMINHDDAKSMTTRSFSDSERKAGRLPKDWQYGLPTEEQWEYAARAGTSSRFYFGDDMSRLPKHANFGDRSYYESRDVFSNAADRTLDDGTVRLAIVGSYEPNPWGLFDVYGNVAEWCINLAIRGGGWVSVPHNCRSAYRDSYSSRNEQNFIGYRLVIQKKP